MSDDIIIMTVTDTVTIVVLLMVYVKVCYSCVVLKTLSVLWLDIVDRTVVQNINVNINTNILL